MTVKKGPRGPFLGCSGYPKCRSAKPMPAELKEQLKDQLPAAPPKKELPKVEVNETCPECGGPMKLRESKKRAAPYFLGCAKYPKCKGTPRGVAGIAGAVAGGGGAVLSGRCPEREPSA